MAAAQPMRLMVDDGATSARDDDDAVETIVDSSLVQQADYYAQQVPLPSASDVRVGAQFFHESHIRCDLTVASGTGYARVPAPCSIPE